MPYSDWKIKGSYRCDGCQMLVPNEHQQKHHPKKTDPCGFAKTGEDQKAKARSIAENLATLDGDADFKRLVIVISYGALVSGEPDLTTLHRIASALSTNKAPGSLSIAKLPETIKQIAAKGQQWEGFRGELEEFCRRAEKSHIIRVGTIHQQHKQLLVSAEDKIGKDVVTECVTQLESLEGGDELGGDVIDFTKKKVIQVKYLTGKREATFGEKVEEAAAQLVGELKPDKNEVPIESFRREISIIIMNPENKYANAQVGEYKTAIETVMSKSVNKTTGKSPGIDAYFYDDNKSNFSYFVETVRVQTPFQKLRFVRGKEEKGIAHYDLKSHQKTA